MARCFMSLLSWYEERAKVDTFREEDWLSGREPLTLLAYLRLNRAPRQTRRGRRKLRRFACACARRHWDKIAQHPWMRGPMLQQAVVWAERFADGEVYQAAFDEAVAEARGEGWNV